MKNTVRTVTVCYFGTYRLEYSRNQIMIEGLRTAGVKVIECHETLWHGIEDRVQAASGGWLRPRFILRLLLVYWHLLRRYRQVGAYDILVVGYPGQLDVFLARLLTWLRRKPMVWDIFMSIYLIALERGLGERSLFTMDVLRRLEWAACRLPDLLILDTSEYVNWFGMTHGVSASKFRLVPTGADSRIYHPLPRPNPVNRQFRVIYYGSYIRNHGVENVVEAARLLADDLDVLFEMIGEGPERAKVQEMADQYHLGNISFVDWLEKSELVEHIAQANVCLGAFGSTPQSLMTVQNKIYEGLAMAKPVITGDSSAVRQVLEHGRHVYLCERENPQALATAILTLKNSPKLRQRLSEHGYQLYCHNFDLAQTGKQWTAHLHSLIDSRKQRS